MGKVKGLIGLVVILATFYVAWNLVPPYFHNYQLQDDLDDVARRNSYTTATDDDVKKTVISKAANDGITLKEDQIVVTRSANGLAISVKYRIHLDMAVHLPFVPVDLDFSAISMNKRI